MQNNQETSTKKDIGQYQFSKSLEDNKKMVMDIFVNDGTLITRSFENRLDNLAKCCIFFVNGMVKNEIINENIIKPIINFPLSKEKKITLDTLQNYIIHSNEVKKAKDVRDAVNGIIRGDTILFLDSFEGALIINTLGWQTRAISEPEVEKVTRGPREGFNESLTTNLTLIRRKIQTTDLKFSFKTIGKTSQTKICLCYLDSIVDKSVLANINKRLDEIDIDGVLASGYITELIRDFRYSPFKTIGSTERPDAAAGKLLEGRIVIVVDGSPVVLTVPYIFIEYFQVSEDYYINFYFSSISRFLRILGFFISISVVPIFIAVIAFHQEMIPTSLAMSIAEARQGIPFPSIVEAFGLLVIFEILRETAARMPPNVGMTLGIVGALVIGQAAVEARFVSATMIIIVALSGITGLMIPKAKGASILLRTAFLLFASYLGLYGYIFGLIGLMIHLFTLNSFGVPYMSSLTSYNTQDLKDTVIRAPWWNMNFRPRYFAPNNKIRQGNNSKRASGLRFKPNRRK